jgi:hypothetical protein
MYVTFIRQYSPNSPWRLRQPDPRHGALELAQVVGEVDPPPAYCPLKRLKPVGPAEAAALVSRSFSDHGFTTCELMPAQDFGLPSSHCHDRSVSLTPTSAARSSLALAHTSLSSQLDSSPGIPSHSFYSGTAHKSQSPHTAPSLLPRKGG